MKKLMTVAALAALTCGSMALGCGCCEKSCCKKSCNSCCTRTKHVCKVENGEKSDTKTEKHEKRTKKRAKKHAHAKAEKNVKPVAKK